MSTDWLEIATYLQGTCRPLEEVLSEFEAEELMDNQEFLEFLDDHSFLCTQCNWWCEISKESSHEFGLDEWTCLSCCEEITDEH